MRRLLVARRVVPLDLLEEYMAAWNRLVDDAGSAGVRAWLFRGAGHEDHFTEFLEWEDASHFIPEVGPLTALRNALDTFGHATVEILEEAT